MKQIKVDFADGKFFVRAPIMELGRVRGFPNRRWVSRVKAWVAPAIRANVEYIKANLSSFELTDVAMAKVRNYERPSYMREQFPAEYEFKTEPRVIQRKALNFLWGRDRAALFMDMRTGKTKTVIDWVSALSVWKGAHRLLVVCPLSVRETWRSEFAVHCPVEYSIHLLDTKKVKAFEEWEKSGSPLKVLVVGVESLAAGRAIDHVQFFCLRGSETVMIVDESSKIKNHSAQRTKRAIGLGKECRWRAILTGTPMGNSLVDLFAQYEFLDTDIIGVGDYYSFRARYCVMGGFERKQIVGYQNTAELIELVKPYTFQARKADVFENMPPKTYIERVVEMTPEQRRVYESVKKGTGEVLQVRTALEKMLRLQQIAGGFLTEQMDDGSQRVSPVGKSNSKLDELMSVLDEVEGQVVVWAAFRAEIDMVYHALVDKYGGSQVVKVDGSVGEQDRKRAMAAFQGGDVRFYVGTVSTSGMGVSLSAADVEIYYSNTFSYIDREQSEERAFNEKKPLGTLIVDIMMKDTVDRHVLKALKLKKDVSEYVREHFDEVSRAVSTNSH